MLIYCVTYVSVIFFFSILELDKSKIECYIIGMYILTYSKELLLNYGIETVLTQANAMQEQYAHILKGTYAYNQ